MRFMEHMRYRLGRVITPTLFLMVFGYLGYHAIQGNYGLVAYSEFRTELVALELEASLVRAERQRLEARVVRLRRDNLDPELLDERARAVLGFTRREEFVILNNLSPASDK